MSVYMYACIFVCMYEVLSTYVCMYFCRGLASADVADEESEGDSYLGLVPHQV